MARPTVNNRSLSNVPAAQGARRIAPSAIVLILLLSSTLAGIAPASADEGSGEILRAIVTYESFADVPSDNLLESWNLVPLYRFGAVPAVVVNGTAADIDARAGDPGFSLIEYDHEIDYFMDTATFATRVAEIWQDTWWPGDMPVGSADGLTLPDGTPIDGTGITIGVVDSGINAMHPDLWYAPAHHEAMPWTPKVKVCVNSPTVPVSNPYCDQTVGHGTHVAGIAAGTGWAVSNGLTPAQPADKPYVGAAPGAQLAVAGMGAAVLVIDATTSLDWMYQNRDTYGINVVTNSWGDIVRTCSGALPGGTVISITNKLVDAGIPVLFAAGNYFPDALNPSDDSTYTSTYSRNPTPGVISVSNYAEGGLKGRDGSISSGSSDGCAKPAASTDDVWSWPDLAAPGTSIASTAAYTGTVVAPTWDPPFYAQVSGTSMATPHVAGTVALMLQANPELTPAQIEQIVIETATPWTDGTSARSIGGTTMWGSKEANNPGSGFTNPGECKVMPADAAKARAGDTSVNTKFARFTQLATLTNPDLFVCRDFKRGVGLLDGYAAVAKALALRGGNNTTGNPVITVTSPLPNAQVPAEALTVSGRVNRDGNDVINELPVAAISASPTTGAPPLDVDFTISGSDTDGTIASWSLDFGDGETAATGVGPLPATIASHTYVNGGTFTAELTVVDNEGGADTASISISVAALPQPDGTLDADVYAYNEGGVGASNVVSTGTEVLISDSVPKYVAGETVSVSARQSATNNPGVPITAGTTVSLFIFDEDGDVVFGPVPMNGVTETGIFACTPACYSYAASNVVIGTDWEGRYYLAPRATVDGVDYWIGDRTDAGLKKIDVIGVPDATAEPDDSGHDIGDSDSDATTPFSEIQWVDTALDASELSVVIELQQAGNPAGDSPFLYGVVINNLDLEVYVFGSVGLYDNTNDQLVTGGSAAIDPVANTVTVHIPRAYLAGLSADCPCTGYVESRFGEGLLGGQTFDDRAPDAGFVELKSALVPTLTGDQDVASGSPDDPEATDPAGDAGQTDLPWMDITKLWVAGETSTQFDIVLEVVDMSGLPPSSSTGPIAATNFGAEFCTDSSGQTYTGGAYNGLAGVVCYRLSAQRGIAGDSFTGSSIQKDGSGSCGYTTDPVVDAANSKFDQAANTVTWRVNRLQLNVDTISGAVADCSASPPTRNGAGAMDGDTLSRLRGSTGNTIGWSLVATATGTFGQAGDTSDGSNARPYTFGTASVLSVNAGGPYSGLVDAAIPVTGTVAGGMAPYTCTWSGAAAVFADAASCGATTVTFDASGSKTITLTVTDSSDPVQAVIADATVTVNDIAAGERVEVFVDDEPTPRFSVSVATDETVKMADWSGSVDLTGLVGSHDITAVWIDADESELDRETLTVNVLEDVGVPFVTIDTPADDPSGQNPLTGTINLAGTAGHQAGSEGQPQGFNAYGFPVASGSRGGLRNAALSGELLAPCNLCDGAGDAADLGPDVYLASSVTWEVGPDANSVDGYWFDVAGYGGSTYELDSQFGDPLDIFFYKLLEDVTSIAHQQGQDMPKTGTVPPGASWAFVYNRLPGTGIGFLETALLNLTTAVVPPSAPQNLAATPGPNLITLTWGAPANDGGEAPTAYKVYRDDSFLTTLGNVLTYTDVGLVGGQDHTYEVTAINSGGESVQSNSVTAAALGSTVPLSITNPLHEATNVPATTNIEGTYDPQGGGTTGSGSFANTHYIFLYNLNSACGDPLGYGDHVIASKLIKHAKEVLGVPAGNIHFYNEYGQDLSSSVDQTHYPKLPPEMRVGSGYDGRASPANFNAAITQMAAEAAAGEAAGGPPARLFVMHSSHGLHNPANLIAADGPLAEDQRFLGSMMCLVGQTASAEDMQDYEFGGYITDAVDAAEAANAGVDIELGIMVDCSFCGGFADSPTWIPGTTTTAVDSANVVGDNRVVEVGCTWITECFGNPAVTYDHIFNECTFKDAADGYGPVLIDDLTVASATHHAPNGIITLEEAYWCGLDSVQGGGSGFGYIDPIGIQQLFQIVDDMHADMFADDGFILWDIGADQDLRNKDPSQPLAAELPSVRTSVSDEEGDALLPYLDVTHLEAVATSTDIVMDLTVADLTLSSAEVEDLVEYNFFVNGDRIGVCYTLGAPTVYNYNLGPEGAYIDDAVATYDFATGVVHVELPRTGLNDGSVPASLYAESWTVRTCFQGAIEPQDRIPNAGEISTSADDDDNDVTPGVDEVRVTLTGPGAAIMNGNAVLDAVAGTWSFDPVGDLVDGTWTVDVSHFYNPGTGTFALVDGPVSLSFSVGSGPDTEAPSQVTGVSGTATHNKVDLSWSATTDNVGVDHYSVHRGGAAGFTPGAANKLADTENLTVEDTGLASDTTYYYVVRAVDAAGNLGAFSTEYAITTENDPVINEVVSLYVDGGETPIAQLSIDSSATGSAEWAAILDTTTLADGQHTLRADYDDGEGGSATDMITFHTQNFVAISITAPAAGEQVDKDVTVTGTVAGATGEGQLGVGIMLPDGTLNQNHFAVSAMADPAYELILGALEVEPGFLQLAPAIDGFSILHASFEDAVPEALPLHLLPEGWELEAYGDVRLEPLRTEFTDVVSLEPRVPAPMPTSGIGPGSTILVFYGSTVGICTANFVWEDVSTGKIYLGAAGHCFMPEDKATTHGADTDWNRLSTTTYACNNVCLGGGSGLGAGAVGAYNVANSFVKLGELAYARQTIGPNAIGNDFGVVEIPDNLRAITRTSMMVWEGPTHETTLGRGDLTVHYGNAVGMGEVFPTKARVGLGYSDSPTSASWRASVASAQGDSGSAVNIGVPDTEDVIRGDGAVGVLTHLSCCLISAGVPPVPITAGTTTERAVVMAQEAGLSLRMMTEDDDPTVVGPTPPSAPRNLVPTPGNEFVDLDWDAPFSDGGSAITGYTVKYGNVADGPYPNTVASATTDATISGLVNGENYYFVVTATNAEGEGPVSAEVSASPITDPTVPDTPTDVVGMAGDGQVSLSWTAPSNNGSPITNYAVAYGTTQGGPYTGVKNSGGTATTVTGLSNGVPYYFVVSAENAVGEGPTSDDAEFTPKAETGTLFAVQVRALQEGVPVLGWAKADSFDGSAWSHDLANLPAGDVTIEARLLRNGVAVATDVVPVEVVPVNGVPVADAGVDQTVDEGTRVTLDGSGSSDPDNDPLTYSWAQIGGTTVSLSGADTASPSFDAPNVPADANLVFRLTVTDTVAQTSMDHVTISVNDLHELAALTIDGTALADALAGALSDAVTVAGNYHVANGAGVASVEQQVVPTGAALDAGNWAATSAAGDAWSFSWDTYPLVNGDYDVHVRLLQDGSELLSDVFTATVHNEHPPELDAIGDQVVNENSPLNIALSATDLDGASLTYSTTGAPADASLTDAGDGTATFSWTPSFDDAGVVTMTIRVTDPTGLFAKEEFDITVVNVNRAPVVAQVADQAVDEMSDLAFGVSATDADGDALTLTTSSLPAGALFTDNGDGTGSFSWRPDSTQAGAHAVTFTADDGVDTHDVTMTITVADIQRMATSSNGLEYTSVNQALAEAVAGDEVRLEQLTHVLPIVVNVQDLTLCGATPDGSACLADYGPVIIDTDDDLGIDVTASGVKIRALVLTGNNEAVRTTAPSTQLHDNQFGSNSVGLRVGPVSSTKMRDSKCELATPVCVAFTSGTTGKIVDARLNDWSVYNSILVGARVNASGNTVQQTPFLQG